MSADRVREGDYPPPCRFCTDGKMGQERLGLGIAPLLLVQEGQVIQAGRHVRMLGAESLLPDRQGPPVTCETSATSAPRTFS
jgi:hypothetical protein